LRPEGERDPNDSPVRLILASASPRRAELLRAAGYAFAVAPPDVDEDSPAARLPPEPLARFLADAKADAVAARFPDDVTLAADTVVELASASLGKPADEADAFAMIRRLAGRAHRVITGVAVRHPARQVALSETAVSEVRMPPLTDQQIDVYVAAGRWRGKAGGYGIQDQNPIVTLLTGSLTNVIGLPMELVAPLLTRAGISPHAGAGRRK
jgi:septum formation protein